MAPYQQALENSAISEGHFLLGCQEDMPTRINVSPSPDNHCKRAPICIPY